jgi:hypothetical protein
MKTIPDNVQALITKAANREAKKTGRASWKIERVMVAAYLETGLVPK